MNESVLYHVFNRGNNKQKIFFNDSNYRMFLGKIKRYIVPNCHLIAYCLMPNHFHLMVQATERSVSSVLVGAVPMTTFSFGIKTLLSTYAQMINRQQRRTGSLFRQNTKVIALQSAQLNLDYTQACFEYIHLNPISAKITNDIIDWPYSSIHEYLNLSEERLCNVHAGSRFVQSNYTRNSLGQGSMHALEILK